MDMKVFVHNRETGTTELASVASDGTRGDGGSARPEISWDGRSVAFVSGATNLVAHDTNEKADVFVHDRMTGTTERVSVASGGVGANDFAGDPRDEFRQPHRGVGDSGPRSWSRTTRITATMRSPPNTFDDIAYDIFVHDRNAKTTERVSVRSDGSQADRGFWNVSLSGDGRFVGFSTCAKLVPEQSECTPRGTDAFVYDRLTGATERLSVANDGTEANSMSGVMDISADGGSVVFASWATNLVSNQPGAGPHLFVRDRGAPLGILRAGAAANAPGEIAVSGSGTFAGAIISNAKGSH